MQQSLKLDLKTALVLLETKNSGQVSWKIPWGPMQVEVNFPYVCLLSQSVDPGLHMGLNTGEKEVPEIYLQEHSEEKPCPS